MAVNSSTTVVLPPLQIETVNVTLIGDTPLIVHRWSEKAKKQMLDKQMKKASAGKEAKDPERDFRESLYVRVPNHWVQGSGSHGLYQHWFDDQGCRSSGIPC